MPSILTLEDRARAEETLRKRKEERKEIMFWNWLPIVTPKFNWTWTHFGPIFAGLRDIINGKSKRLMIFLPPRSGKSECVTVRFPAWMIERSPEMRFIVAAYNVSLAAKFSRKIQRIVTARGLELDREAVDDWTTREEGGIRAVGVGSGVTGHGANGILIDDPIKPLAIDTPVPTPSGWKMLGDLQIGDKVFDHAGRICNIINVTPHYTAPRMRVTFSDNSTIDAHPSHPWKTFSRDDHAVYTQKHKSYDSLWPTWKSNGKAKVQTVTTSHIAATLTARITMRNWTIPVCGALELPEVVLPVDPYLLGYWLGDGTSAEAAVTVGNKDVPHFLSYIMAIGYVIHSDKANDNGAHRISVSTTYRKQNKWGDSLTRRLRELGVLNNKHIPVIYLRASIQQRLALLRGLMDSDGTIEKTHGETTFVSTSKPLADGTYELIVSLGGKVVVSTRPAANKTAYILRGFYAFQPFALPRKAQRNTAPGQIRRRNRTIVNVEKLDNCDHVCITVDSDSHLFLAGKGMIPVCNSKEEAYSSVYRDKAWEWYKDDLYTRLEPGGFIILCLTRWHYDDLAGRILKADVNKEWKVVKLPALAEEDDDEIGRKQGDALCPDRFSRDDLLSIKAVMGSDFESLYQQNPTAVQGSIFKREWWRFYQTRPEFNRIIQSWDTAFKDKHTNDPSNCQTWGVTNSGYYLIDRWQDRVTFPDLKRAAILNYDKWKPDVVIVEDKASGQSLIQEIQRETKIPMLAVKADRDKISRANAVTPLMESGHVFLPEGVSWVSEYIDQMAIFPAGKHDEDPDVTSQALNYLSHGTKFFGDCRFEDDPEEVKPEIFIPEPVVIPVKRKKLKPKNNPNRKIKPIAPSRVKHRKPQ